MSLRAQTSPLSARSTAVLLLLAVLASACGREVPAKVDTPRPVRTVEARMVPVDDGLVLPAELRPRIETRPGFRVAGKIAQRLVSVGDRVRPGQELARLDPQDLEPAIASARASLDAARTEAALAAAELARQRELRERNFISPAALDRQQATADAARARVEAAQAQLRQATNAAEFQVLRADEAGFVTAIEAEAGQVVAAGQPVVRIARSGEIEALVNVPERDMALLRTGARWRVEVPAAGDRVLEARVREIAPSADPASRTWATRLTLSGELTGVEFGMTARASTSARAGAAIVLPVSALFSTDSQPKVWVVDPRAGRVAARPVRTGGLSGDTVRVLEGLQPGERVVTAGASLLTEGSAVRLLEPVEPSARTAEGSAAGARALDRNEPAARDIERPDAKR